MFLKNFIVSAISNNQIDENRIVDSDAYGMKHKRQLQI